MRVCVFGLWHLGSVISAALAAAGYTVVGLDPDSGIIRNLRNAKAPVAEPGLDALIRKDLRRKTLSFTDEPSTALADAEVVWLGFDTPVDEEDNADADSIGRYFDAIAAFIPDHAKVIVSSQVPVGFTRRLQDGFRSRFPGKTVYFAYSPENLRLGRSLEAFREPDRIIIGTNPAEQAHFLPVFAPLSDRLEWMGIESAEMTKHAINAFLATSICFANEVAALCEHTGADAKDVERGLKTEARIGPGAYLTPGNAFSGGTLARDVRYLQTLGKKTRHPLHLVNAVIGSNDYHKTWIRRRCRENLGDLGGRRITVLGLTYKAGTDTLRRSLSVELCRWLREQGAVVTAWDPAVPALPPELQGVLTLSRDSAESVRTAECIIIATGRPDLRALGTDILTTIRGKIIIDPNGFMEPVLGTVPDIRYFTVGRGGL